MKTKNTDIMISVFSVLTIIVTIIGFSFAYFRSSITGTDSTGTVITKNLGMVTFTGGNNFTDNTVILPGWAKSTTASVYVAPSTLGQQVLIKLDYDNSFTDLQYKVDLTGITVGSNASVLSSNLVSTTYSNVYTSLPTTSSSDTLTLVTLDFEPSTDPITVNFDIYMRLPDSAGNTNMGKELDATLYGQAVTIASETYGQ